MARVRGVGRVHVRVARRLGAVARRLGLMANPESDQQRCQGQGGPGTTESRVAARVGGMVACMVARAAIFHPQRATRPARRRTVFGESSLLRIYIVDGTN